MRSIRIIRTNKNRYGATNEIGIYEMNESGLKIVKNPNKYLISNKNIKKSGHAIGCSIQGIRPLMIEVRISKLCSLRNTSKKRHRFNSKRLNMILAILEKEQDQIDQRYFFEYYRNKWMILLLT